MKKSLISVITLALCLVNLVLTAVLAIAVIPSANQANELITKVAAAIDLELASGDTVSANSDYSIDQIEVYDIADSMTINLKKGADGTQHYAVVTVTLSINTASEDYETYGTATALDGKVSLIKTTINDVVSSYTLEEIQENQQAVLDDVLEQLQTMYGGSDFLISVGFSSATFQ